MTEVTHYVVGMLFTVDAMQVLLIEKNRPEWQRGRYNGIGGKMAPGETALAAMEREAAEEANITDVAWQPVVTLGGPAFMVHFFRAFSNDAIDRMEQKTDERLVLLDTSMAVTHIKLIPNMHWIIAMAADPCIKLPIVVQDAPTNLCDDFMPWADYGD